MKIIHLSDIHIGHKPNNENFDSIINWIINNEKKHQSNIVIITGDIVDNGAYEEYKEAKTKIDKIKNTGIKVLAVPGNHDYGKRGLIENWECVDLFKKYISGDLKYPHLEAIDNYHFILLDSMLQEMKERDFWGAQGELGEEQLGELDSLLNIIETESPEAKVVIALHHHPFFDGHFHKLRDDDLFKKVIMDKNKGDARIDGLLFGHKHNEKRFTGPNSEEDKYNIGVIYSSGSTTSRNEFGKLIIPVIDLETNSIERFEIE